MKLLSIIELGGYPNFVPLYESLGYEVTVQNSMRKSMSWLKKNTPDVVVAEYNWQSDFRDRSSNLETLMAPLRKMPDTRLVCFYEKAYEDKLEKFRDIFSVHAALPLPVDEQALRAALES